MRSRRESRFRPRALTALVAAAGVAAGVAARRHHRRRIAADPEYARLTAPLDGRPLRVVSADGTSVYAEVFGAKGPSVVLVHGWTEELGYWKSVIDELSQKGLRIVAYDLRGHGRSDEAAGGDYSLERFGEDVEAVLAACLPEGDRATVVGHSLGAMSIAAWAEHHDVQVRACAAALVNTGLSDLIAGQLLFPEIARWLSEPFARRVFLGSRARLPSFSTPIQYAAIRYCAFGPAATPAQVSFYERMLISCNPSVRAACGVAMSDMNLQHAVAQLTVPTLVVAGACDRLTPPAHARAIAQALPECAGLIELPDTGHMSPLERPAELSAALADLVTQVSPRPLAAS